MQQVVYTMSEDEKDALIGSLVRQRKQANSDLQLLNVRADKWGKFLRELGESIERHPNAVTFDGEGLKVELLGMRRDFQSSVLAEISVNSVRELRDGIQAKTTELRTLSEKLKPFET